MSSLAHPLPPLPKIQGKKSVFESDVWFKNLKRLDDEIQKPKPTKWQEEQAWSMAVMHRFYLDGVYRIYAFAHWAQEQKDLANYLGFADVIFGHIAEHHAHEEETIFPVWEKAACSPIMSAAVAQHDAFVTGLDETWIYIRRCRSSLPSQPAASPVPEPQESIASLPIPTILAAGQKSPISPVFSPTALREHMETWLPAMILHLGEEIGMLSPETMERIGQKALKETHAITMKHVRGMDPKWFLCSGLAGMDRKIVGQMMALPLVVRKCLVPFVWSGKYWGYWRYMPHPEHLTFTAGL